MIRMDVARVIALGSLKRSESLGLNLIAINHENKV